ncbi:hypothetical protein E2320_003418 [Naja naja]|nr:hypothetical protein E2320_003418 [Naja naja]
MTTETWTSYINRFKCIMDAANLSDYPPNRKKAYFLSFCRATVFDIATALLAPQMIKAVTWEELQEVLDNHYAPKPSRITRHHAFRFEEEEELIASEHLSPCREVFPSTEDTDTTADLPQLWGKHAILEMQSALSARRKAT